jgi:hypothetical protein
MSLRLFTRFLSLVSVCVTLTVALASCSMMLEVGHHTMLSAAPRPTSPKAHVRPAKHRKAAPGRPVHPVWRPLALNYHGVPHGLVF